MPIAEPLASEDARRRAWRRYLVWLTSLVLGPLGLLYGLVLVVDPYGSGLPTALPIARPPLNANQRYQFPALVRGGAFDSFIVGTSTIRPLDPLAVAGPFGGRFANVAMHGATAWEQYRIADLAVRRVRGLRSIVWGIDGRWCAPDAKPVGHPESPIPDWLYDDDTWNDLPQLLNGQAVDMAVGRLRFLVGLAQTRVRADGFKIDTPDESTYDVEQVRKRLHARGKRDGEDESAVPPASSDAAEPVFPALSWLEATLTRMPADSRKVLLLMPVHRAALPEDGSPEARLLSACKQALIGLARRRGATLVDFRLDSELTRNDENYWDKSHFRTFVAGWIVDDLRSAVLSGRDGRYGRVLAHPAGG